MSHEHRRRYADEIAAATGIRSQPLLQAFATICREQFLGPPPWRIVAWPAGASDTSDPAELYRNVSVMLDTSRSLTNGNPASLAPWIDALRLHSGDSVFHLGCGAGYYSAIMAEVVGPDGRVKAVEADARLASMARECLAAYPNVDVIEADGGAVDPGPRDAILINAGVTRLPPVWLDSLKLGATLLAPLTADIGMPHVGKGMALRVERKTSGYAARFLPAPIMIYSCTSLRDKSSGDLLGQAFLSGTMSAVQSLRRDDHAAAPDCWLHTAAYCLSTRPVLA